MSKCKIYSKDETKELVESRISNMDIILTDADIQPKEKFKQICISGKYMPYLISSYGRVFSINYKHIKNSCKQLKTNIDKYGYEFIVIHYGNKSYGFNVHRLVAIMFINNPDPDNKTQVNHKNGNKLYNIETNLEWTTPRENIEHAWMNGLAKSFGVNNGNNVYTINQVKKVCKLLEKDYPFDEISEKTGVSYPMISLIYRKKFWNEISDNYNFSNYNYGKTRKNADVVKICKLLANTDKPVGEIAKECKVKARKVYEVLRGRSFTSISRNYDFSKRKK